MANFDFFLNRCLIVLYFAQNTISVMELPLNVSSLDLKLQEGKSYGDYAFGVTVLYGAQRTSGIIWSNQTYCLHAGMQEASPSTSAHVK